MTKLTKEFINDLKTQKSFYDSAAKILDEEAEVVFEHYFSSCNIFTDQFLLIAEGANITLEIRNENDDSIFSRTVNMQKFVPYFNITIRNYILYSFFQKYKDIGLILTDICYEEETEILGQGGFEPKKVMMPKTIGTTILGLKPVNTLPDTKVTLKTALSHSITRCPGLPLSESILTKEYLERAIRKQLTNKCVKMLADLSPSLDDRIILAIVGGNNEKYELHTFKVLDLSPFQLRDDNDIKHNSYDPENYPDHKNIYQQIEDELNKIYEPAGIKLSVNVLSKTKIDPHLTCAVILEKY